MTTDGRRGKRVAELLRAHLAELLRREVDDPRLAAIVLTTVEVTDDLMSARIGVRLLVGDEDPKARTLVMRSLSKGAGRLRRLIAPRLELRRSPELRFQYDAGHDASRRVEELLHEIKIEDEARGDRAPTEPTEPGENNEQ
ncbi:MAG TPA: 30S ribosome-binding factor RbfA [Polyangiaceae bacterium]|nr:30S ribosome-binding factor RbfA [Polyangiaceae bacterium]